MESWKLVWRKGIRPQMSEVDLAVLREGLAADDARIVQGHTTEPLPLLCVHEWDCEKADVIGYPSLASGKAKTVGEVESVFAKVCHTCDNLLGEPSAVRSFINWADETPRADMRRMLIEEIDNGPGPDQRNIR